MKVEELSSGRTVFEGVQKTISKTPRQNSVAVNSVGLFLTYLEFPPFPQKIVYRYILLWLNLVIRFLLAGRP